MALKNSTAVINVGWYRGKTANFRPSVTAMLSVDSIREYILKGWEPSAPFVARDTRIMTFGSCFAGNIARYLSQRGYNLLSKQEGVDSNVFAISCNEGIVNTFTMLQMFRWLYAGTPPTAATWHDYSAIAYEFSEQSRLSMKHIFDEAELLIITLGLSEVWYDKESGEVFSRAIPQEQFDESRHGFRISTVEENRTNLEAIYALIREHLPRAKVVVTLSPVPLLATFRPISCITANAVSKAVLRVAVDEVLRNHENDGVLHYWPSYEIVMEGFPNSFGADNRHVKDPILDYIMTMFEVLYCTEPPAPGVEESRYFDATVAAGQIHSSVKQTVTEGSMEEIHEAIARFRDKKRFGMAIIMAKRALVDRPNDEALKGLVSDLEAEEREFYAAHAEKLMERHRAKKSPVQPASPDETLF